MFDVLQSNKTMSQQQQQQDEKHIHSQGDVLRFGLMGSFDQERFEHNKDLNANHKTEAQRSADMHTKVKTFASKEQLNQEQLKSYHLPNVDAQMQQQENTDVVFELNKTNANSNEDFVDK